MNISTLKGNITKDFTYEEIWRSKTADRHKINNKDYLIEQYVKNAENIVINILQPLRNYMNCPIVITSFFRCSELNKLVGGSNNSQHMVCEAVDFICQDNAKAFNWIKNNINFDQLIWEYGDDKQPSWVHVSLKLNGVSRKEVKNIK